MKTNSNDYPVIRGKGLLTLGVEGKTKAIEKFAKWMDQLITKIADPDCNSKINLNSGLEQLRSTIGAAILKMDYEPMLIGFGSRTGLDEEVIRESIAEDSANLCQTINKELASLHSKTGDAKIPPPRIEEKEESHIRAELTKIFLVNDDLIRRVNEKLDPKILEDNKEKIWEALSLIRSDDSEAITYLHQFKKSMETLPEEVKKALVPIIYQPTLCSIPSHLNELVKKEFIATCLLPAEAQQFGLAECPDLAGFYLMGLDFRGEVYRGREVSPTKLNFKGGNFSGSDLSHSNLQGLCLEDANLSKANLTETDFRGTNLIGTKLKDAYWEEGLPPLIDRTTQFIPDWFYPGGSSELSLSPTNKDSFTPGLLGRGINVITNLSTVPMRATSWLDKRINIITELALPSRSLTKKVLSNSSNDQRTKTYINKIQEAFNEVTPEMKDHILKNIGPSQRRALEAILAYKDPDKKITATDAHLILPKTEGSIIIPGDASMLETGLTAGKLIQEEIPGDLSLKYNLTLINQQAALKNLAKVSGNHTNKDFSKLEITLRGTLFDQARLDSANLSGKDLSEAVFNECRLIKTNLSGAKLQNTIFNNCDLSGVNLSKAEMQGTTFHNCNLSKSTWEKALMDGVTMINCTIKDVDIEGMSSHNWFLDHCILDNVNFKGSEEGKGIFINQMGLVSSIIINSNIEGNTNFHNIESIGSVLAIHDPGEKLLNNDLSLSPLSYINNSPIQIALEAVFQKGSIYSKAFQDVEYNGINFGSVDLMDLSGLSQAAIGYQPQRFINVDPKLLESMK
jgi:uncharacterized protein YjbI with pentapeptide repeats